MADVVDIATLGSADYIYSEGKRADKVLSDIIEVQRAHIAARI